MVLTAALHYRYLQTTVTTILVQQNSKHWQTYAATSTRFTKRKISKVTQTTPTKSQLCINNPHHHGYRITICHLKSPVWRWCQRPRYSASCSPWQLKNRVFQFLKFNYLDVFWRLRISCSFRRCWNRAKRAWRLTKPEAFRDNRKLSCAT